MISIVYARRGRVIVRYTNIIIIICGANSYIDDDGTEKMNDNSIDALYGAKIR